MLAKSMIKEMSYVNAWRKIARKLQGISARNETRGLNCRADYSEHLCLLKDYEHC
jgi:hypothetical protein